MRASENINILKPCQNIPCGLASLELADERADVLLERIERGDDVGEGHALGDLQKVEVGERADEVAVVETHEVGDDVHQRQRRVVLAATLAEPRDRLQL